MSLRLRALPQELPLRSGRTSKGALHFKGSQRERWKDPAKATQASWMPSCAAWQAGPICEGFWEGQCWLSHPEKKNLRKTSKAGVFLTEDKPLTQASGTCHRGRGCGCEAALPMTRKVWPYRGQGCLEVFPAKGTEEMRPELSVMREPKVT